MNPMFAGQSQKYEEFRATFKIWLPSLMTLDGIDFAKDQNKIKAIYFKNYKGLIISVKSLRFYRGVCWNVSHLLSRSKRQTSQVLKHFRLHTVQVFI